VVTSPAEVGPENDCAGEDQQQLETTIEYYIRTMKASVQLKENLWS
jgi:hypothetical protein